MSDNEHDKILPYGKSPSPFPARFARLAARLSLILGLIGCFLPWLGQRLALFNWIPLKYENFAGAIAFAPSFFSFGFGITALLLFKDAPAENLRRFAAAGILLSIFGSFASMLAMDMNWPYRF